MVPWQFSRNEFRRRPGRNLLTLGSVAIGVATLLAVSVSSVTTHNAFREMYQTLAGRAALEVRAEGGDSFEAAEVLKTLDAMPEIKAAVPVFQRPTVLFFHSQRMNMLVLGIDPEKDRFARDYFFEEGNQFPHGNEVLLEAGFARNIGAKVGDEVSVLTSRGPRRLKVIGLLASKGAAAFQGGSILFVSLPAAQTMYRARGQVDSIYLVLNDEGSEDKVAGALAGRLPPGIGVHRPAMRSEMARETLLTTEQGLNIAGALSLVAAVFIIINAFFMNLTERRRQLATLRAMVGSVPLKVVPAL